MSFLELLRSLFSIFKSGNPSGNIPSPRYEIKWEDINYYSSNQMLEIAIDNAKLSTVQNTNSMEPLIDVGHRIILSDSSKYLDNLNLGDIIIWNQGRGDIIHSIVEIGSDNLGTYYRTQGLYLNSKDPELIRKVSIKYVCLGVIWTKGEGYYTATNGD